MPKNKRKKSFVHRAIQGALIRRMLLQWIVFIGATLLVTLLIQFLLDPLQSGADRSYQLRLTVGSFLAVSLCLIPLFVLDSVKLSNRFVGPILRLHSFVQQVGREDVGQFNLRKGDYWHSLAEEFNSMLGRLRSPAAQQPADDAQSDAVAT